MLKDSAEGYYWLYIFPADKSMSLTATANNICFPCIMLICNHWCKEL